MEKEIEFCKAWQQQINQHINIVSGILAKCSSISKDYVKSKEGDQREMFNIFHIISDLYYRENFHSDIISFFLNPKEKHGGGSYYLSAFIKMLNKKGKNIDSNDYQDAEVTREEGKVDILIKSDISKKAIIIENKINNAGDMQRQIPRYYDYVAQNSYIADAIVYLPLDIHKTPNTDDWTQEDKDNVNPLLVIIPAYDKSGSINLVKDWLQPSILLSNELDVVSILRQYSVLIKQLNNNNMDKIVLEKFYQELLQNDNLQTAQSIRNMLNEIPAYLALRIQEKYSMACYPFSKIWIYRSQDAVFEGAVLDNAYFKMDIWCYEHGYDVVFWTPNDQTSCKKITDIEFSNYIRNIKSLNDFVISEESKFRCNKHFDFFDESGMYAFIDQILKELGSICSQNK